MHSRFLATGSLILLLAVVLGAFGAHGLRTMLGETPASFETGVRYHFYHGFAIMLAGFLYSIYDKKLIRYGAICFIVGVVLFSGSLYALTFLRATGSVGLSGIGLITPVGGLFFVAGWIFLTIAFLKSNAAGSSKK
jgi:uncharacterized membrane protein YgdD (TMEM256/DUF423 family)